jgi:hypothetical protein
MVESVATPGGVPDLRSIAADATTEGREAEASAIESEVQELFARACCAEILNARAEGK